MQILGLNHVALQVADVKRTVAFYTAVVGLEELPRPNFSFPGAWLRIGPSHELHIIQAPEGAPAVASGSRGNHFAMTVTGLDDYRARLEGHCHFIRGPVVRPDNARQVFFEDPDGHTVELVEMAR